MKLRRMISLLLALPMCFGMMSIAKSFMSWYIPVWPVLGELIMLGCPVIILISMSNVTGIQYMVPTGMYNQYSASVIAGSCVNFLINLYLIPRYGAYGAIVASVIAEATVTGIQLFPGEKLGENGVQTGTQTVQMDGHVGTLGQHPYLIVENSGGAVHHFFYDGGIGRAHHRRSAGSQDQFGLLATHQLLAPGHRRDGQTPYAPGRRTGRFCRLGNNFRRL